MLFLGLSLVEYSTSEEANVTYEALEGPDVLSAKMSEWTGASLKGTMKYEIMLGYGRPWTTKFCVVTGQTKKVISPTAKNYDISISYRIPLILCCSEY